MGLLHVAVNQQRLLQKNRFARPGSHQDIGEAPSAGHPENPVSFRPGLDSLAGMKLPLPLLLFLVPVLLPAAQAPAVDLVFAAGSDWEVVSSGHQFAEGMAWDVDGNFIFSDVPRGQLFKVDKATGAKMLVDGATGRANGLAFGIVSYALLKLARGQAKAADWMLYLLAAWFVARFIWLAAG